MEPSFIRSFMQLCCLVHKPLISRFVGGRLGVPGARSLYVGVALMLHMAYGTGPAVQILEFWLRSVNSVVGCLIDTFTHLVVLLH